MKSLHAVIGAQYGDEGKGLLTDYLSSSETLVVRYNGGAQAGHTVVTPDGRRHEFHHVSAGTFRGASTLLSRFFLVNPMVYVQEREELRAVFALPTVYVDRAALVTTPVDMLINRAVEQKRSGQRHGSCGLGINETVERSQRGYPIPAWQLGKPRELADTLAQIERDWLPQRLDELQVSLPPFDWLQKRFLEAAADFERNTVLVTDIEALDEWHAIVFEGAQGLMLDELSPYFPHVTRSRTGLPNICTLLQAAGIRDPLQVHYVTRCYATRHGAGPLPGELSGHPFGWTGSETNQTNPWQGRFRYAHLEPDFVAGAIRTDLTSSRSYVMAAVQPQLAVTCLDQAPSSAGDAVLASLVHATALPVTMLAAGPTRATVAVREAPAGLRLELG